MSSFVDAFAQPGDDSAPARSNRPFDDGYIGFDPRLSSQRFDSFSNFTDSESVKDSSVTGDSPIVGNHHSSVAYVSSADALTPPSTHESTQSPPSIYASAAGFSADPLEFSPESNGKAFDGGPILPPLSEMQSDEGFALREWRRENAIHLLEKEKREKEMLNEIIDEADEYKVVFYRRRMVTNETNKNNNREKEKLFVSNQERFHAEANKNYWKAIAELIPREVPTIEKRRGKKDQDKKPPSVSVIQGPKPGKPTDLSRMRQILVKLKHNTPPHLKPSPPAPPKAAAAVSPAQAVVVA